MLNKANCNSVQKLTTTKGAVTRYGISEAYTILLKIYKPDFSFLVKNCGIKQKVYQAQLRRAG